MITLIRSCHCARFFLEIPDEDLAEFKKQFKEIFPDGRISEDKIVSICIKDEEDFKEFLNKFNQK